MTVDQASGRNKETGLPVDIVIPPLKTLLGEKHEAILQAPPGAGKTTRVPLALLDEPWLGNRRIIMLEPRRLAARAAAEHMARLLDERVGQTVGYRVRLETCVGPETRIEVVTEGVLTRLLQADPALEGVGLLIFDEFHERSLEADLSLALTLHARQLLREDDPLRLLIMSATLESERLSALLGNAGIIRSEGRLFPVDIRWRHSTRFKGLLDENLLMRTVLEAIEQDLGSVLVFLPGLAEIRRFENRLQQRLFDREDILICPLHGQLELADQRRAIEPPAKGLRKVVLATNIAETSLTIEGVSIVIDSGLVRQPRFDPATGMTRLALQRISRASATQRAGRAGRLMPGICYRLWSPDSHERLPAQTSADILQADLAGLALQLARWGASPEELSWLDVPPVGAFAQAKELLTRLGALSGADGQLTEQGRLMSEWPVHPRLAHLLLKADSLGLAGLGCDLAALLSERDLLPGQGCDVRDRVAWLQSAKPVSSGQRAAFQAVRQLSRRFRQLLPSYAPVTVDEPGHRRWLGCLLAFAYPDRIARQRRPGGSDYRLANGRAARFADVDALMKEPWLVIAHLGGREGQRDDSIYLAVALDPALFHSVLAEHTTKTDLFDWDDRQGQWRAERQWKIGDLLIAAEKRPDPSDQEKRQALLAVIRRKGLALLPWTPALRQWQARVLLLQELERNQDGPVWPDVSDEALLNDLESWLGPYLDGISRLSQLAALDLKSILQNMLSWSLSQRLEELAPLSYAVPSGSRIRIDYNETPPVLAVRLQELFGLQQTPRIAGGRLPLKLHLLSPASRPVQVTQDLANFWRTTYAEVKRDLKGRYPKHHWPDDPLQAQPTARAKRRQSD